MKKKNIIIVVLVLLLGVSLIYIGYDRLMSDKDNNIVDNDNQENENTTDNGLEELKKIYPFSLGYDEFGIKLFFEENYLKYLPIHYYKNDETRLYHTSNLTDEEISMMVWKYIFYKKYVKEDVEVSLSNFDVQRFIDNQLNLKDYVVKETNYEGFKLKKVEDKYVIIVPAIEFRFLKYYVTDIKYKHTTQEILVSFIQYSDDIIIHKIGSGIATYKTNGKTDSTVKFWLEQVEFD